MTTKLDLRIYKRYSVNDRNISNKEMKKTFTHLDLATDKARQDRRRQKITICLSRIRTRTLVGTHRLARQRNQYWSMLDSLFSIPKHALT
ncbi:hypothetical protein PoB_006581600 [Plakobranchus ocellatus]|uniref:Uncharacterized protein n=1 Tax=Plakobranchus ocellatus TaxID=259542 RepID=A0AAV4D574_9GAST|nr:hypothetical protein PoB_006581600 [Plakobranchus ocellatus]